MVKFSSRASNLMFVLIAIQVTRSETGKLRTTQSVLLSNGNSSAVTKSLNANDDKKLTSIQDSVGTREEEEQKPLPTAIDVKKADARATFSYFYVGRWTWHIPLWFTLWFTLYVAFNVFRAINGHHVSLYILHRCFRSERGLLRNLKLVQ